MTTVFDTLPDAVRQRARERAAELNLPVADTFLPALIDDLGERRRVVEALILEGLASGPGIEATDQFWDDLISKHEQRMMQVENPGGL